MNTKAHTITLTLTTAKDIPDMLDIIAGRVYVIDGVVDCAASIVPRRPERSNLDEKIEEFNKLYALPWNSLPTVGTTQAGARARIKDFMSILYDEVVEGNEILQMLDTGASPLTVLTALADWLGDLQIYCMSEMKRYGLPNELILGIIMASNMSKLGEDGLPMHDERGKVLKGPNYWSPEPQIYRALEAILRQVAQEKEHGTN